jgi:predicted permease
MLRDLRHAVRVLLQAKGWTAVVLVSLALGIGANAALFSAINGVLLQTIEADEPDALVRLSWHGENDMVRSSSEYGYSGEAANGERRRMTFSYPAFEALCSANETLVDLFAAAPFGRVNFVVDGQAEIASSFLASGSYFRTLGVGAAAGRTITPVDDDPAAAPVGRDPQIIGATVGINGRPFTIVGVTAADYAGIQGTGRDAADVHIPLTHTEALGGGTRLGRATNWWLQIMGRLRPGITAAQVRGNLEGVFQAAARQGMDAYLEDLSDEERSRARHQDLTAVPRLGVDSGRRGIYDLSPNTRRDASLLGWVVLLVLLIVCANVANLLLSRATARRQEISVRLSIGATRGRLIRQMVTEGVFLSAVGGGLGLLVAYWARRLLPFGQDAPLDWRLLAFVALLSVATGIAFSLVPAIRATGVDLSSSLKDDGRGVAGSRSLLSKGLLVLQVAVSLVLLVGAGLFLGTLRNLRSVDVGFDPTNILLFRVNPTLNGYEDERLSQFYGQLRDRLQAIPGVRSVSLSESAFLAGSTWTSSVHLPGQGDEDSQSAHMMSVSPEFFETMRVPLLSGRLLEERDGPDAAPVAVVNATAVRELFENENALGRRFGFSLEESSELEIVGVVQDVKYANVREAAPPTIYLPYLQGDDVGSMTFEVRTATDPRAVVPAVREAVRALDANLPLMDISTQSEQIERRFSQERFFAVSYSLFGALATLLAAIGLFGLASYNVARRTNEIGVRMALGARPRDVVRLVLGESLTLVAVGIVLGLGVTLAAGRFVRALLFDLAPTDAVTLAVAVVVMLGVSAVAGYLPARRASRVDPMTAFCAMGLLASIRDLRRRVAETREVTLHHYVGFLDSTVAIDKTNIAEQVARHESRGRLRLLKKLRLKILGRWLSFVFLWPSRD